MFRHRESAAVVLAIAAILSGPAAAQSSADGAGWMALEASWCTAPHDDYRRSSPVVEIRQFRDVRVVAGAQARKPDVVTVRMRSAMVSTQTKHLEFVGTWIEYSFEVLDGLRLSEPSIGLALSLSPDLRQLTYRYGDSRAYVHERCGAADVELVDKAALPDAIATSVTPPPKRESAPANTSASAQIPADAANPDTAGTTAEAKPELTAELNRSHCLAMQSTPSGFFGFVNKCTEPLNYTYCTLDATTANGRLTLCRSMSGEQIGEASGFIRPDDTAYLSMPVDDMGRVIWFACKYPGEPSLTRANPPGGRCR